MLFLLMFYSSKNPGKPIHSYYKNIKQHNYFQYWKSKIFFEQQINILECFLIDHVTLKTGFMMLKIQLRYHRNIF